MALVYKRTSQKLKLTDKKRFIPDNKDCGEFAVQSTDGDPS